MLAQSQELCLTWIRATKLHWHSWSSCYKYYTTWYNFHGLHMFALYTYIHTVWVTMISSTRLQRRVPEIDEVVKLMINLEERTTAWSDGRTHLKWGYPWFMMVNAVTRLSLAFYTSQKRNVVLVFHHWNWQGAPLTAIELQVKEKHSKDTSVTKRTRISLINLAGLALFPIPNLEFSEFIIIENFKHARLIWRNLVNLTQCLTVAFWSALKFHFFSTFQLR